MPSVLLPWLEYLDYEEWAISSFTSYSFKQLLFPAVHCSVFQCSVFYQLLFPAVMKSHKEESTCKANQSSVFYQLLLFQAVAFYSVFPHSVFYFDQYIARPCSDGVQGSELNQDHKSALQPL